MWNTRYCVLETQNGLVLRPGAGQAVGRGRTGCTDPEARSSTGSGKQKKINFRRQDTD